MDAPRSIYLDNAATSFPKPEAVWQAMDRYNRGVGASAGRGSYREAVEAGRILDSCRDKLRRLLGVAEAARVVFTFNASDALNIALKGVLRPGDHVVTTWMDHNSVLRPLRELEERGGVRVTRVRASAEGVVAAGDVAQALRDDTRLVVMLHASNVTGSLQPAREVAALAHARGALFLLDAAQTAGARPVLPDELGADLMAFPGHKSLLGPLGTGALYMREGLEVLTLREGGTGSRSEEDRQPQDLPDRHEAGSHNLPGIAGLEAALDYLLARGLDEVERHKRELCRAFLEATAGVPRLSVLGPRDPAAREPVFPLLVDGFDCQEVGTLLDVEFGIKARSGLHCAPLAHRSIGSFPGGATRLSFGPLNTLDDVAAAAEALCAIARASSG